MRKKKHFESSIIVLTWITSSYKKVLTVLKKKTYKTGLTLIKIMDLKKKNCEIFNLKLLNNDILNKSQQYYKVVPNNWVGREYT